MPQRPWLNLLVASLLPGGYGLAFVSSDAARTPPRPMATAPTAAAKTPGASVYVLGPEDQIMVQGPNAEDIANKPFRIDGQGEVIFPLLGSVHAGGLTVREFEQALNIRAKSFLRNPQLVVNVTEFRSQPVSVIGAVNSSGVHQIEGRKTLVEMISLAGGLRTDAGSTIHITRSLGKIPLPQAHADETGFYSVADIRLQDITSGARPDEDIQVLPHDVISISKAASVYVIGEVKRPGGFPLGQENSISVVQAVSLAEGAEKTADLRKLVIVRNSQFPSKRQEIPCDLAKILRGKAEDISLQAQDILYVPGSTGKKVALKALETAINTGSGIAIFGIRR